MPMTAAEAYHGSNAAATRAYCSALEARGPAGEDQPRSRTIAHVVEIERFWKAMTPMRRITLSLEAKGRPPRIRSFQARDYDRIRVRREGTCLNSVCEAHLRDLGGQRIVGYCHWNAWESAPA